MNPISFCAKPGRQKNKILPLQRFSDGHLAETRDLLAKAASQGFFILGHVQPSSCQDDLKNRDRRAEYLESFENKPDNMSEPHLLRCEAGQAKEQDPGTAAFFRLSFCRNKGSSCKELHVGLGPPNQHVQRSSLFQCVPLQSRSNIPHALEGRLRTGLNQHGNDSRGTGLVVYIIAAYPTPHICTTVR